MYVQQAFYSTIQYFPHIVIFTLSGKIAERKNKEIGPETDISREKQQKPVKFTQKLQSY
jgi:hypothetical protein